MDELNDSSAMQNGATQVPQQTDTAVSTSPQAARVALPITQVDNVTASFSTATEVNSLLDQVNDEDSEKMDEKQDSRELNNISSTVNNLTAIADTYDDSDTEHGGDSAMEIEQEGTLGYNNSNNVNTAQLLDVRSSTINEEDVTEVNISPGAEVFPAGKISSQGDLITSEENKVPSDTTTTTTTTAAAATTTMTQTTTNNKTEVSIDLLYDAGFIMNIVGEELESLDNCMDVGVEQSAGVKDVAKAGAVVSSHDNSNASDDESSSSSDITGNPLVVMERVAELEDVEEERAFSTPPKTKDELSLKDLPDEPELEIEVDENIQLIAIGEVHSIVEMLVVVHALPHTPALDSGSYLFLESREYLGMVFEIFGPVQSPYYSIRFNSDKSLEKKDIQTGVKVCYAPDVTDYSIFVFMTKLRRLKGSDASWKHDQEPPTELIEYSDDEEEAHVKSKRKQERKAKNTKETDNTAVAPKQKQHVKVGRWSWRNRQQGSPSSEESTMVHPQGTHQFHSAYNPLAHTAPFERPRPHFELPGNPRGPHTACVIRPSQGPLSCPPIVSPPPGHPMGHAGPFMGNPRYGNGPPFGVSGFGHTPFMQGPIGHAPPQHCPPGIAPYQHGPSGVAPYQHGPFYSNHIHAPPHFHPSSGPP